VVPHLISVGAEEGMMGVDLGTTNLMREATEAWRETGQRAA
jgi:hypothetical protein